MSALGLEINQGVATLTLNRPQAGNAIDQELADALLRATHQLEADASIRAVILTGAGRLFCAGGDIAAFAQAGAALPRLLRELTGALHMAIARLYRLEKPILCAVNGPAAGAGLGLALIGDVVIATDSAHFSVAYPKVGLSPDAGCSFLLPRLVGLRRAQRMILLGDRVSAREAQDIGLITQAVSADSLSEQVEAVARDLSAGPTRAFGRIRNLLADSFDGGFESHLEKEARAIGLCGAEADAAEGIAAFIGRRPPHFRG